MNNSDYLFDLVQRQRHQELVRESAERRLAKSARTARTPAAGHWWARLGAGLGLSRPARPTRRPVHLQSVQS